MNNTSKKRRKKGFLNHQQAIWFFSFLLLIMFMVFSLGAIANIHRLIRLWQYRETALFMNISQSVANVVSLILENTNISNDYLSDPQLNQIKHLLNGFESIEELNILIATHNKVYPVIHTNLFKQHMKNEKYFSQFYKKLLKKGWNTKFGIELNYQNIFKKEVNAQIIPFPQGSPQHTILIIIEKDLSFDKTINKITTFLDIFLFTGIVGVCLIVVFYGRRILKPFNMLESILERDSDIVSNSKRSNIDPVQKAIDTFEITLNELKIKQKQLERLNEQLEKRTIQMDEFEDELISSVDSGIVTFDQHRKLISMTSKIPNLLGINPDKSLGKTCEELLGTGGLICSLLTDGLKYNRIQQRRQWKWEIPGKIVWLSISTTLIKDDEGNVTGVGFIFRDVTESKKLEELIREKQHLAALGELSAGIAHEFRNPLGVIRGNADLLENELTNNELIEFVREIKKEISNLDRIIRDFLKFARPTQLSITQVDLYKLLKDVVNNMKDNSQIEWVLIKQELTQKIYVEIDENLFRQVLVILIENAMEAVKYQGKIEIRIDSATKKFRSKQEILAIIHIIDNGPGISPNQIDQIFKPFFTTKQNGTGLGLAIAKKLILLHNGYLEVVQEEQGAHFIIILPQKYDPDRTVDLNF